MVELEGNFPSLVDTYFKVLLTLIALVGFITNRRIEGFNHKGLIEIMEEAVAIDLNLKYSLILFPFQ